MNPEEKEFQETVKHYEDCTKALGKKLKAMRTSKLKVTWEDMQELLKCQFEIDLADSNLKILIGQQGGPY